MSLAQRHAQSVQHAKEAVAKSQLLEEKMEQKKTKQTRRRRAARRRLSVGHDSCSDAATARQLYGDGEPQRRARRHDRPMSSSSDRSFRSDSSQASEAADSEYESGSESISSAASLSSLPALGDTVVTVAAGNTVGQMIQVGSSSDYQLSEHHSQRSSPSATTPTLPTFGSTKVSSPSPNQLRRLVKADTKNSNRGGGGGGVGGVIGGGVGGVSGNRGGGGDRGEMGEMFFWRAEDNSEGVASTASSVDSTSESSAQPTAAGGGDGGGDGSVKMPRRQHGAVGESDTRRTAELVDPLQITVGIVDGLIPSRTRMSAFASSLGCTVMAAPNLQSFRAQQRHRSTGVLLLDRSTLAGTNSHDRLTRRDLQNVRVVIGYSHGEGGGNTEDGGGATASKAAREDELLRTFGTDGQIKDVEDRVEVEACLRKWAKSLAQWAAVG